MPIVEIITIGTEILLGDILDTNSRFIAQNLKQNGYDLFRISTIGDNQARISSLLQEALQRSDIIITTGGLGPTVDDPTREAVAQAFNLDLVFQPELWEQISKRFLDRGVSPSENNRKQAYLPENAIAIKNNYGTAPGIILPVQNKYVICLQGVPQEMEHLLVEDVLPFLHKVLPPSHILFAKVLHAIGIGESVLDTVVGKYEKLDNPTVGLLAHAGLVDIRIVGSGPSAEEAKRLVSDLEIEIRKIVADNIFGCDDETIESVISHIAGTLHFSPEVNLFDFPANFELTIPGVIIAKSSSKEKPFNSSKNILAEFQCSISSDDTQNQVTLFTQSQSKITRKYLGPSQSFLSWARNIILYYTWLEVKKLELENNEQS